VNDDKRLRMVRFILRDGIVIPIELITRIKRTQVIDFWSNPNLCLLCSSLILEIHEETLTRKVAPTFATRKTF
ncbi:hypothetical protein Avbf_17351, partial [Armadillidium vulgare]